MRPMNPAPRMPTLTLMSPLLRASWEQSLHALKAAFRDCLGIHGPELRPEQLERVGAPISLALEARQQWPQWDHPVTGHEPVRVGEPGGLAGLGVVEMNDED